MAAATYPALDTRTCADCGVEIAWFSKARYCRQCRSRRTHPANYDRCACGKSKFRSRPQCWHCTRGARPRSARLEREDKSAAFAVLQDGEVRAVCWCLAAAREIVAAARAVLPGVRLEIRPRRVRS